MTTIAVLSVLLSMLVSLVAGQQVCRQINATLIRSPCDEGSFVLDSTLTDSRVIGRCFVREATMNQSSIWDSKFDAGSMTYSHIKNRSDVRDTILSGTLVSHSIISGCNITNSRVDHQQLYDCTVVNNDFSDCFNHD